MTESLNKLTAQMRANPLESALLFLAFAATGLVMYTTVAVALDGDRARDLTFAGTTSELGRTLAAGGPGRVGRLDRARLRVGRATVAVDTIVARVDSVTEPAFAARGFVRDQIVAYNDFVIRQAVRASVASESAAREPANAPTLLQTVWTEDGTRVLSDRPSPYGMVIRSPYAEGAWREVRTIDWRSSPGLLGHDGDVRLPADSPIGLTAARLNGRDCAIDRQRPQFLLYCKGALAAESGRFYDFGFQILPGPNGGSFGTAGPYRQGRIWMNGRPETFGRRQVAGGDVFDIDAVGPFMLSPADWGTLTAVQWINGRRTFANPRMGTLSFFASAGRSVPSGGTVPQPLVLGFDAGLASDLEREASRFMAAHEGLLSRMVALVIDVRTGEVRAVVEPSRDSDDAPLLSFEPILVGSAVKPIIAAAILTRYPALADMKVAYAGDTVNAVGGIQLKKGFANASNGCAGEIDFTSYLRCSSNQYAAELLVRSMQLDGMTSVSGPNLDVPRAVLEKSAIAAGLAEVFDVDAYANRTTGRLALYWNPDSGAVAGAVSTTTDRSLIPYESRPWILFANSKGTPIDWISRYAFGGWENRWTLLGLGQAYARIATDHSVQATFLHRTAQPDTGSRFPRVSAPAAAAFARVRVALREVAVNGTAAGLADRIHAATAQAVTTFAKTGTLNETSAGGRLKSLVMAIGLPETKAADAPLGCGMVVVTYFEFTDRAADAEGGGHRAALPRIHRDFAEGPLANALSRNWSRVSGCDRPAPTDTTTRRPPLRVTIGK